MNANQITKQNVVKEIVEKISKAKSLVVAEYAGLSVKEIQELRNELQDKNSEMKVYKNRLFKIAAKEAGFEKLAEDLVGPNTFAFGFEDEIAPSKVLFNFGKKHKALKIKSGIYEGKVVDEQEITQVAQLPSMEEALAQLAMSMIYPLKNLSIGLNLLSEQKPKEV